MKNHRKRLIEILEILKEEKITKGINPEKFRVIIEKLGPTFIKLGQIMSMRNDILPMEYCEELKKLQNSVEPLSYEKVKEIIEKNYGIPLSLVFHNFSEKPIGSASIAQVHKAELKDGKVVAIKIQRENIYEIMFRDVILLKQALKMIKFTGIVDGVIDFNMVIDEIWQVAKEEMDFLIEAKNIEEFAKLNKDIKYIKWPEVIMEYTNSKILVMEYIEGIQIDKEEKLRNLGYDLNDIGEKLINNYMKQVLEDRFFHADPHPGNICITQGKIVWLDFGMMGRISAKDQKLLRQAILSFVKRDINGIKNVILIIGKINGEVDHSKLYEDIDFLVSKYAEMNVSDMDISDILDEFLKVAKMNNISMPKGVSMLSRGILTIQGVIKDLCPEFNFYDIIKNYLKSDLAKEMKIQNQILDIIKQLIFSGKKATFLFGELSDLINMTIKGQSKLNLELKGSLESLISINNMVNKIVLGMISVGLFIGSSIICITKMKPRILGIPALGFIGFLLAFILSVLLIIDINKKK
ncbi:MAG: AarF/ABC1/UbiB kinase family protein [Clostridium sp.]|uniref:ABC1 kinase family protein n=1 Tax=Clostridium sp. DSM 8431 TaxID=1761781 RepID=UPI0008F24724|nr:AarF/UbiB family protein [Clostridium sp. DSM 8431]MCR4944419.1 AarF/ABC1/UbiB kinase family protein [Clostridium sp.]SFU57055.1 ubiquinone biosynthesis protein [Clostridium sp. DSM 8431]